MYWARVLTHVGEAESIYMWCSNIEAGEKGGSYIQVHTLYDTQYYWSKRKLFLLLVNSGMYNYTQRYCSTRVQFPGLYYSRMKCDTVEPVYIVNTYSHIICWQYTVLTYVHPVLCTLYSIATREIYSVCEWVPSFVVLEYYYTVLVIVHRIVL